MSDHQPSVLTESTALPHPDAVPVTPTAPEAPPKRTRRTREPAPSEALPAVVAPVLPVAGADGRALRLAEAKAEMELQRAMHDMVEQLVVDSLKPGVDYGISHPKRCTSSQPGAVPFHGPGNCASCGKKPDLWLPGAEKIVLRLGYTFGEPIVAEDMMRAVHVEAPYVAYRVQIVRRADGEIAGHGIGACTLANANGDLNTMFKKAKKNAFVDGARNTFALSGIFADAEDVANPGVKQPDLPPGAAPAPAPASNAFVPSPPVTTVITAPAAPPAPAPAPASVAPAAAERPSLDRVVAIFDLPSADLERLYVLAGWKKGDVLTPDRHNAITQAAVDLCQGSLREYIAAHGGWPDAATPALVRQKFFLPWIATQEGTTPVAAGPPPGGLVVGRVADVEPHPAIPPDAPPESTGPRPLEPFVRYYALENQDIEMLCVLAGWTRVGPLTDAHRAAIHAELMKNLPAYVSAHGGLPAAAKLWAPHERRTKIFRPWLQWRVNTPSNPAPPAAQGA